MFDPYTAKLGEKLDTGHPRTGTQFEDIVNKLARRGLELIPFVEKDKSLSFFVAEIGYEERQREWSSSENKGC